MSARPRRFTALAATVGAALAPFAVTPPAVAAPIPACQAYAHTPTADDDYGATAFGGFGCASVRPVVSVIVCLEALGAGWERVGCADAAAWNAADVSASVRTCRHGVTLIRTWATGTASTGESGTAASSPIAYFCSPV